MQPSIHWRGARVARSPDKSAEPVGSRSPTRTVNSGHVRSTRPPRAFSPSRRAAVIVTARREGHSHDDDASAAGPRHRSEVGSSRATRDDLTQVVHGAGLRSRDDADGEVPTIFRRAPAQLVVPGDRLGAGGCSIRDVPGVRAQRHDGIGLGFALDVPRLCPSDPRVTTARPCWVIEAGLSPPGDRTRSAAGPRQPRALRSHHTDRLRWRQRCIDELMADRAL